MQKKISIQLLITGIAGSFGAILRYLLYWSVKSLGFDQSWIATICVNVIGAFLLAFLGIYQINIEKTFENYKSEILGGLIGSFTTFSTLICDMNSIQCNFSIFYEIEYLFLTILFGIVAAILGIKLAEKLNQKNKSNIEESNNAN